MTYLNKKFFQKQRKILMALVVLFFRSVFQSGFYLLQWPFKFDPRHPGCEPIPINYRNSDKYRWNMDHVRSECANLVVD